jgi:dolichol-phosphate mannosyltransferase
VNSIALIPVYEDTPNLLKVLAKFTHVNAVDEICLIIDGMSQAEVHALSKTIRTHPVPIHVIHNETRRGIGYALKCGIQYALKQDYDVTVILAGNNKDDPREIPRLLYPIEQQGYDYVQGSRFLPGGRRVKNPFLRGVFSRLYPMLWTLATRVYCTDVTNGFRAYRTAIFADDEINIWQQWLNGYELEYYLHYKVLTLDYKTVEMPVSKIYPFRHKGGYSKIQPHRDWWPIIRPFLYLLFRVKH